MDELSNFHGWTSTNKSHVIHGIQTVLFYYFYFVFIFLFTFSWISFSDGEEVRTYTLAPTSTAEQIIKEIIDKRDYPNSFFIKITAPTSNLDVNGILINEKDIVVIAKIKPNIMKMFTDNPDLPTEFRDNKGVPPEISLGPYYLNYLLFISTDVKLSSCKLYRKDVSLTPAILKRGTYLWYSGANGIFLESTEGHFLVPAQTPLKGELLRPFSPTRDPSARCIMTLSSSNEYRAIQCKTGDSALLQANVEILQDNRGFIINTPTNTLLFK
ncbi:MAG: hypothetical protein FJ241_11600 [Nitrospira sp.]|nr:hypothetical protein [Nitrospira sp.]